MRAALLLGLLPVVAGCGQTGSLYLPDEGIETPVEIRTPAPEPEQDEEEKEVESARPPGS